MDCNKLLKTELDAYIKNKHKQEECIGFIDGFERACKLHEPLVKNLSLSGVSQQREQFINLLTSLEKEGGNKFVDKEWIVDNYLKIN